LVIPTGIEPVTYRLGICRDIVIFYILTGFVRRLCATREYRQCNLVHCGLMIFAWK
jgi:hypothetical protein